MDRHVTKAALLSSVAIITQTLASSNVAAQGCEPIRFTTPVNLGGQGDAYQRGREWQLTLAYRRLVSNEWFVGTEENSSLAPGGEAPVFRIHTFVADVAYALNDRYRLRQAPPSGPFWAVPDVYSARLGGSFSVLPEQGLTLSLGARVDGIPVHDLLGGGDDDTVKRSSRVVFADPGLSFTRGRGTLTASVPYRVHVNREKSLLEERTNGLNAGGFASYLVFLSYTHRL